jgi:uncharacterized protein (DUF2126 family)
LQDLLLTPHKARIDEGRDEKLYNGNRVSEQIPKIKKYHLMVDRILKPTDRHYWKYGTELNFCIDKLYSPDSSTED